MFKLTNTITGVATLALAALPVLALTTAAHAGPMTVKVGDLSTSAAVAAFEQRLDRAASTLCAGRDARVGTRIVNTGGCHAAVRAEAMDNLTPAQRGKVAANGRAQFAAR